MSVVVGVVGESAGAEGAGAVVAGTVDAFDVGAVDGGTTVTVDVVDADDESIEVGGGAVLVVEVDESVGVGSSRDVVDVDGAPPVLV
jgi:hypothetical protein